MRTIIIADPEHWRQRAKESLALAHQLADPTAKQTLLEIAQSYEQLAQLAEKRKAVENQ